MPEQLLGSTLTYKYTPGLPETEHLSLGHLDPGLGTMYPPNPPLAGPDSKLSWFVSLKLELEKIILKNSNLNADLVK